LTDVLSLPKPQQTNNHAKRLVQIMCKIGWHKSDTVLRFGKDEVKNGFTKAVEG
jgi:hypothetical protein